MAAARSTCLLSCSLSLSLYSPNVTAERSWTHICQVCILVLACERVRLYDCREEFREAFELITGKRLTVKELNIIYKVVIRGVV